METPKNGIAESSGRPTTTTEGAKGESTINMPGVDGITKTVAKSLLESGRDRLVATTEGAKGMDGLIEIVAESTLEIGTIESKDKPKNRAKETTSISHHCTGNMQNRKRIHLQSILRKNNQPIPNRGSFLNRVVIIQNPLPPRR